MRKPVAFYESHAGLSPEAKIQIRAVLTDASVAEAFIAAVSVAAAGYSEIAAAWSGPTPADTRAAIERLGTGCRALIAQILSVDDWTEEHVREAQVFEGTYGQPTLENLQADLQRLSNACVRAAALPDLNRGQGSVSDDARHDLIRKIAAAYSMTTGKDPKPSRNGTFAKLVPIVCRAVGADPGVSHDLLKQLLPATSAK